MKETWQEIKVFRMDTAEKRLLELHCDWIV